MATVTDEDMEFFKETFTKCTSHQEDFAIYRERIEARKDAEREAEVNERHAKLVEVADKLAAARTRIAELESAISDMGKLVDDVGTAAGLRDVGFKAPEQIVEAVRELRKQLAVANDANRYLQDEFDSWARDSNKDEARIKELESQLSNALDPSHYSSKDGRIRELEAQLAAVRSALGLTPGDRCIAKLDDLIRDLRSDCYEWAERTDSWMRLAHEVTGIAKGQANMGMLQNAIREKLAAAKPVLPVLTAMDEDYCRAIENGGSGMSPSSRAMAEILRKYTAPPKAPPTLDELVKLLGVMLAAEYGSKEHDDAGRALWDGIGGTGQEQLTQLLKGPTWDGDILSKHARDRLLHIGLATRCCMNGEQGYTAATYPAYTINALRIQPTEGNAAMGKASP